jgi:inner membrane protein
MRPRPKRIPTPQIRRADTPAEEPSQPQPVPSAVNPVTHFFLGWCTASVDSGLSRRDRTLVTLAAVVPDADGLGAIPELLTRHSSHPLLWFSEYHHAITHNLLSAVITAVVVALCSTARVRAAILAFLAFHTHLLGDLVGSRGPDGYVWPIPYLLPFTTRGEWAWSGAWHLNDWQNVVITALAVLATMRLAWVRGYSPVGIVSERSDGLFVGTLRNRFPRAA